MQGAYVSFKRWKAPIKSRKTHKLRKIDDLAEKYAELAKFAN